ncbi:hypothetical protein ACQJBY_015296 [Aegilops geniculata]
MAAWTNGCRHKACLWEVGSLQMQGRRPRTGYNPSYPGRPVRYPDRLQILGDGLRLCDEHDIDPTGRHVDTSDLRLERVNIYDNEASCSRRGCKTTTMSPPRRSSPRSSRAGPTDIGDLDDAMGRSVLICASEQTLHLVSKKMAFVVMHQSMSSVQCVLAGRADAGVSKLMVRFSTSLSKESTVDVESIITLPKEPLKSTTQQIEI